MKHLFCGLFLWSISSFATGYEEPSPILIRTSYCACRCCESDQDVCFRHESIPPTFKCSESMCNEKFCEAWEKAKCSKECFCQKCKGEIPKDDYRCLSFTEVPSNCKCEEEFNCSDMMGHPAEIDEGVKSISSLVQSPACIMPCFCKNCKDSMPTELYGNCLKAGLPSEDCNCEEMNCPSKAVLDGLKKLREMRSKKEKAGTAHKFSDELDEVMTPDKAKVLKCRMQCFCDVCSVNNDKTQASCEQMLPKPRLEGCECDPDEITCPSDDVDQHCKVYCFCKGCAKDPRMTPEMVDSCNAMTKKDQACMCAEKEDCSLLTQMPQQEPPKPKKKSKKGKLKPKKTDKDEL